MDCLDARKDFTDALMEVDIVIELLGNSQKEFLKYQMLNKAAILLLSAKLESFLESAIQEFCYNLSHLNLMAKDIPNTIKLSASSHILSENVLNAMRNNQEDKSIDALKNIALLWNENSRPEIKISHNFSYGKHGEKEIIKLFKRIGINDVFDHCKISVPLIDMNSDEQSELVSVSPTINAIIGYRNCIIHGDGIVSGLTHTMIISYKEQLTLFALEVEKLLLSKYNVLNIYV